MPGRNDLAARLRAKGYAPVSDAGLRRNMGVPTVMLDPSTLLGYTSPVVAPAATRRGNRRWIGAPAPHGAFFTSMASVVRQPPPAGRFLSPVFHPDNVPPPLSWRTQDGVRPMKLFLIALWAFVKAHPDASFEEFQLAADRAARLARWPG